VSRFSFRWLPFNWFNGAGALALPGAWPVIRGRSRPAMRTGGPDNDNGDDEAMVRKLIPIVTVVVIAAALFD
jgi:hypothetical protein